MSIRSVRESYGLSRKEFAKIIKLSPSTIKAYELKQRTPSVAVLKNIAKYFGVKIDLLLED